MMNRTKLFSLTSGPLLIEKLLGSLSRRTFTHTVDTNDPHMRQGQFMNQGRKFTIFVGLDYTQGLMIMLLPSQSTPSTYHETIIEYHSVKKDERLKLPLILR